MAAPQFSSNRSRVSRQPSQRSLFPAQEAEPPRAPDLTPGVRKAIRDRADYQVGREATERRSVLRGLIFLAILILLISLVRAGVDRAFFTGWWRQW